MARQALDVFFRSKSFSSWLWPVLKVRFFFHLSRQPFPALPGYGFSTAPHGEERRLCRRGAVIPSDSSHPGGSCGSKISGMGAGSQRFQSQRISIAMGEVETCHQRIMNRIERRDPQIPRSRLTFLQPQAADAEYLKRSTQDTGAHWDGLGDSDAP